MHHFKLNSKSVIYRDPDQVFSEVDDEVIMLNIENSEYYNLRDSAGLMWNYLKEPITLQNIVEQLMEEYDVTFEDCLADIQPFIQELVNIGILKISDE